MCQKANLRRAYKIPSEGANQPIVKNFKNSRKKQNMKNERIEECIDLVEKWVEKKEYKSYEPFDGLSSFLRPLTFNKIFPERILQQIVRQSPLNLRPILGVKPLESTKGRGYMAWGYLIRYKRKKEPIYLNKTDNCFDWLLKNKAPGHGNACWGNHFDFTSRAGKLPKHEPIIVWTSLIGQAALDTYEETKEKKYFDLAKDICAWIINLPRERTDHGICLSYVKFTQSSIHNSNLLGAAMLARTASISNDNEMMKVAKEAIEYSCTRQRDDGSWYYGEGESTHWIDNFHTGYNLDSLYIYIKSSKDNDFMRNLINGIKYYREHLFKSDGTPKYYHNKTYPVDIQCASQAIDTLTLLSEIDEKLLSMAKKTIDWTIDHMFDKKGYFYYRVLPIVKDKTPMLHWGQATMYKALNHYLLVDKK
jgi:rhamnogalacturonyl hydrolase YesR